MVFAREVSPPEHTEVNARAARMRAAGRSPARLCPGGQRAAAPSAAVRFAMTSVL